jgi:deoxyribodipyrimidine photo-lyase
VRANSGKRGGCWDVLAWKQREQVLFVESKQKAPRYKDSIQDSQKEWLEAAMSVGVAPSCFVVCEWDIERGYPWASDRFHAFIVEGMAENARRFRSSGVLYYPYIERARGAGRGLLAALAAHACVVVTDDFPCFFVPRMIDAASRRIPVRLEAVDSNGLLPLRAADRDFSTAYAFRRFLQKTLPAYLEDLPSSRGVKLGAATNRATIPAEIVQRWPRATERELGAPRELLARLPIDHGVPAVEARGGSQAGEKLLREFVRGKLGRYADERNEPDQDGASGLSPYLHFGHISAHQVFASIAKSEKWSIKRLALRATGSREGWWRMSATAEAFLDQIVTWRELGFNFCAHRRDYDKFSSLPAWAQKTLERHGRDERAFVCTLGEFENAATHDPLWNAAQTQLRREGRIHNYLRMLWGKKILEWSPSPEKAAEIMIELNNKYALDGRDPNSYSGIFWCLGRYDRPWGPERPIFGTVRYMSSENAARKLKLKGYLKKYAPEDRKENA